MKFSFLSTILPDRSRKEENHTIDTTNPMSAPTTSTSSAMGASQSRSRLLDLEPEHENRVIRSVLDIRMLCQSFRTCCRQPSCNSPFPTTGRAEHIERWSAGARIIPPTRQLSVLVCTSCAEETCVGCNSRPSLSPLNLFTPVGVINHCCNQGRLFTIYFLLCRFDDGQVQPEKEEKPKEKQKKKPTIKGAKGSSSAGVGYASGYGDMSGGYGHGWDGVLVDELDEMDFLEEYGMPQSSYMLNQLALPGTVSASSNDQDKKENDTLFIETLRLLGPCLPSPTAAAEEEMSLFRVSMLFDRITDLIRNDAISDVIDRSELYTEVIAFVKIITNIPSLAALLFEERPEKSRSPGIRDIASLVVTSAQINTIVSATLYASVYASSKNLVQQLKTYLKLAAKKTMADRGLKPTPWNTLNRDTMRLCESILEVHATLKAMADTYIVPPGPADPNAAVGSSWVTFQQENKVTFTDEVLTAHRWTKELSQFTTSVAKNRLNTISKEVATLTTSLPDGIFLKIAESRSDVMKVLIIGSEGSPYAGGLFTFDIWLPAEYPVVPPRFAFVLDGNDGDPYSFNPNLHVGGSVCLSILNTWSGMPQEMWQPNKSTLLAVLVSIQAMILGAPFPWHNEPGHENEGQSTQVKENKKIVQMKTVRHAMTAWAENKFDNPKLKEHVWKDIVQAYFAANGDQVLATADAWVPDNPYLLEYSPSMHFGKGHKKSKSRAPLPGNSQPVNLINKLAIALGKDIIYPEPEVEEDSKEGLISKLKGKRKGSQTDLNLAHHTKKKQKSEGSAAGSPAGNLEMKWVYTGGINQKESRAACKAFGVGAATTIKGSITKLENHVNIKGKANPDLLKKWGKMIYVDDSDREETTPDMTTPSDSASILMADFPGMENATKFEGKM